MLMRFFAVIGMIHVVFFLLIIIWLNIEAVRDNLKWRRSRTNIKALPCPVCGLHPDIEAPKRGKHRMYKVKCCHYTTEAYDRYANAVAEWNDYVESITNG